MILNRQRRIRIPIRNLERFTASAMELLHLPVESFAVCLVTDREMTRWNRAYRGKDRPTDVLSFPSDENPRQASDTRKSKSGIKRDARFSGSAFASHDAAYLGDIAIAPAVARNNAVRWGRTFEDEMRILILHGILHLLGYDHEADTGQMDRRERRLRRALGLA